MVIYLKDRDNYWQEAFYQGLLQGFKQAILKQQQEAELEKRKQLLQEQYNLQIQKAKELADYQHQLADQERNKTINTLSGYNTPTIEEVQPQPVPDNPIDIQVQKMINPQYNQPVGLMEKFKSMMPQYQVGQEHIKGLFSDQFINQGIPTPKDYTIANVYLVSLPKVERPKPKKYEAKVIDNAYFTFDPETGEWKKQGEIKKVIKENSQRMLVDTGTEKLLIDKKDGSVIKKYPVNSKSSNSNKNGSSKFSQYYNKFLDLRKQIRLLNLGKTIDPDTGMIIPIPDDLKEQLKEETLKDLYTTLDILRQENPEQTKIIEEKLKKDPFYYDFLNRTPAPQMPKPNINQPKQNKKPLNNNPFSIFER